MFVSLDPFTFVMPNITQGDRVLMGNSLPLSERTTKKLPPTYFGVGDDAFVNSDTLLTPWSGRGLSIFQDSFMTEFGFHYTLVTIVTTPHRETWAPW